MQNIKKILLNTLIIFTLIISVFSIINRTHAEEPVLGCMDITATNYNSSATQDDGSCTYPPEPILGCMDVTATNYNPEATQDDSSCVYPEIPPTTPDPVSIHLSITTNSDAIFNQNITINACDSDNPTSGTLKVTAYCAVLQSGVTSEWNTAWAPGIFLNSINGISGFTTQDEAGLDVYHYWNWGVNGADAMVGMNQYTLQAEDQIYLTFIDPQTETEVEEQVQQFHSSGSSAKKETFDFKKALEYLASQQKADNTFGAELYTDWVTIAFSSSSDTDYLDQKTKLIKYFSENKISDDATLTDLERHVFALMALNLNPYNANNINYIEKIISHFDSKTEQFGDENQDNDDIFAILVLQNAGFELKDMQIAKSIDFILSKQNTDGSWGNNPDLTAAGIQALIKFSDQKVEIKDALEKAKKYLKDTQKDDASWENVSSTAWATNSIYALTERPEDWNKNRNNPLTYLRENQENDGSIKISETENLDSKIWKTSYAVISASEKSWNEIMHDFDRQEIILTPAQEVILENKIENSNQAKFMQKIEKFQKTETKNPELQTPEPAQNTETAQTETAKTSWFKKVLNLVKFLFS